MTREEAIYRLKNNAWLGTDKDREETEQAVDMAIEALSADVVEVVRCKNCDKYYICPYISIHSKEGGYCSLGKRREE